MTFFWPFIKGPYIARFLDAAGQSPLNTIVAVAMCAAFLCLACGWMRLTVRLTSRDGSLVGPLALSYLASFAVELPMGLLPEPGSTAFAILMPTLSAVALGVLSHLCRTDAARTAPDASLPTACHKAPESAETPSHTPIARKVAWLLAGLVAVIYAASGVMSGVYSMAPVQGSLLSACLAVPLVVCTRMARERAAFSAWLWGLALVPLIMSALFVIVPSGGIFAVGLSILTAGRRGVFMLLWPLLAECALASARPMRASYLSAAGYVAVYLVVRTFIASMRAASVETSLSAEALQALTLAVALVIVACSLGVIALVMRARVEQSVAPGPAQPDSQAGTGQAAMSERELRSATCQAIAQEAALTEKEELVLEYVSMGYTVARIAQEHGVTENTVRTHTKGLYRKLNVHSKQEVIELVEGRMGAEG